MGNPGGFLSWGKGVVLAIGSPSKRQRCILMSSIIGWGVSDTELWCVFVVNLSKLLNKESMCRWFVNPWGSCNVIVTLSTLLTICVAESFCSTIRTNLHILKPEKIMHQTNKHDNHKMQDELQSRLVNFRNDRHIVSSSEASERPTHCHKNVTRNVS